MIFPARFPSRLRLAALGLLVATVLMAGFVAWANFRIVTAHRDQLFDRAESTPVREMGLVLGANRVTRDGSPNLHFVYRMDAAAALYHAGRVRHLLVSGDNHRAAYDEPAMMREALVARGVPVDAITCDYAGFRTLDSVVRARRVFGLTSCTIVTQRYHNTRALEIARASGLDAIGFCTRDVDLRHALRTELREVAARAVTVLDLYVWHRQPRFSGPGEPLVLAQR